MANDKQAKSAKSEKPAPRTPEMKAALFVKVAENRTTKALKAINLLENLASTNYASSAEQRGKIVAALSGAVSRLNEVYSAPAGTKSKEVFKL